MLAGGFAMGAMLGLTVHLPLYYEVVYHLSASEAGLGLIPLAAISTLGAALAGRTMARVKHYKRVAIIGTLCAALIGCALTLMVLPLWALLALQSVFALGLGTTFRSAWFPSRIRWRAPRSALSPRPEFLSRPDGLVHGGRLQRDPVDGAGADVSLVGENRGPVSSIPVADMIAAFRYVFALPRR